MRGLVDDARSLRDELFSREGDNNCLLGENTAARALETKIFDIKTKKATSRVPYKI